MAERVPIIYGLEFQSRALTARTAETDKIQFLCGTQTIRNENQIHLVDYDEETSILNKLVYQYTEGEIWDMTCSSVDKDLVAVVHGKVEEGQYVRRTNIIQLDGSSPEDSDVGSVTSLGELTSTEGVYCTCWHPGGIHNQLATVNDKAIVSLWSVNSSPSSHKEISQLKLDSRIRLNYSTICWNSHHNYSTLLVTADSALFSWDTRTKKVSQLLDHHHGPCIRDIDTNPNRPYYLVSCGDDCTIQFWDWRKLQAPLVTRRDHSHWVWSVQYNQSYDQLVLSSSSDSQVLLTRVASVASEPLKHLEDEEEEDTRQSPPTDNIIAVYEEHEDSVYKARWSSTDAWIFASLSYDGRLVINHVPANEKYAILTA